MPWVESLATDATVLDLAAWTPDTPIPYARLGAPLVWRCAMTPPYAVIYRKRLRANRHQSKGRLQKRAPVRYARSLGKIGVIPAYSPGQPFRI